VVGLAIFDHPANRPRAHWHVRDYGLFSANPFGQEVFKANDGAFPVTLEPGQDLILRYVVLIHLGDVDAGKVVQRFEAYLRNEASTTPESVGKRPRSSR
jgi:hypothetical protein